MFVAASMAQKGVAFDRCRWRETGVKRRVMLFPKACQFELGGVLRSGVWEMVLPCSRPKKGRDFFFSSFSGPRWLEACLACESVEDVQSLCASRTSAAQNEDAWSRKVVMAGKLYVCGGFDGVCPRHVVLFYRS